MNNYKVKYVICTEFLANNDEEAATIIEKNANVILGNGVFYVKKFKITQKIEESEDEEVK